MSDKLDTSLENVFPDDPGTAERLGPGPDSAVEIGRRQRRRQSAVRRASTWTTSPAAAVTLRDHVGEQIAFAFADPAARLIARELADALDEAGYFRGDLADIARAAGRRRRQRSSRCSTVCQTFEPAGNLRPRPCRMPGAAACAQRDRLDPAMQALLANLELLARRDFPGAEAHLRRRRGGPARHAGRDPAARPAARHRPSRRHRRRDRRRRRGARRQRRQLDRRAQPRDAAPRAGRPDLFRPGVAATRRSRRRRISSPSACRTPTG